MNSSSRNRTATSATPCAAAYGWAIWSRAAEGLAVAAAFQAGIYLFHYAYERPFIRRAYPHAGNTAASVAATQITPSR
ncbi:hypothetical protein [Nonomuraea diastatica]|uniref:Uncharacterized protein n=1 Tax=Nonomuraea diastatica TaxID=1848329 RepID=A0A4R4VKY4_9ACTN|nr:hypothetical protein [Nonomuraea diastatica]TDD02984.1 hypothetical protein E1294_50965 [Nonomuraea diastatica]